MHTFLLHTLRPFAQLLSGSATFKSHSKPISLTQIFYFIFFINWGYGKYLGSWLAQLHAQLGHLTRHGPEQYTFTGVYSLTEVWPTMWCCGLCKKIFKTSCCFFLSLWEITIHTSKAKFCAQTLSLSYLNVDFVRWCWDYKIRILLEQSVNLEMLWATKLICTGTVNGLIFNHSFWCI